MAREFIQIGSRLVRPSEVRAIDLSQLAQGRIVAFLSQGAGGGTHVVEGVQAFDAVHQLHPSAVEGVRLSFGWNAWVLHNLVAHPLMQLLAFAGQHSAAFWVHDATVPRPRGASARGASA